MSKKEQRLEAIERFVNDFDFVVAELAHYSEYLNLSPEAAELKEVAMGILKKKAKKMKKADDLEDLNKQVKIKKLLESKGLK